MKQKMKVNFFRIGMFPTVSIKDEILDKLLDVFTHLISSFMNVMNYLEPTQVLAIPSFDEQLRGATYSPNKAWEKMYR